MVLSKLVPFFVINILLYIKYISYFKMTKDNVTEKTLINPINRTDNGSKVTSSQLQEFSVDSILTDETNRTVWINGMPYGNAYVSLSQNENPIHGEIFNDFENNKAIGNYSHAEGFETTTEGIAAHAEGFETFANGKASHAEGISTISLGDASHVEGVGTKTTNEAEHASGKYNDSTEGQTLFSVGIGDSDKSRLNALEITNAGNIYVCEDDYGNNPCQYPGSNKQTIQKLLNNITHLERITYSALTNKIQNNQLSPGKFYRITDYITTTSQENTTSAAHQFDIIVLALSDFTISEEAWAAVSESDTSGYFSNSNLSAWKIWYCLENDKTRFAWADKQNGKGVIYRMIDEFGNDCPYDFKNIMFKILDPYKDSNYTFNGSSYYPSGHYPGVPLDTEDWSLFGDVKNNIVYCDYHNIPKISFYSSVTYNPNGSSINYCCNNNIINSDEIYIRGSDNTVMSSHNISITGSNCNIPTGSYDLSVSNNNTMYLNEVASASPKYGEGLLNNIRTADDQIMVIPEMEYDELYEGEQLFGLFETGGKHNFSIEEHVRQIGYKDNPNFCISIPEYVHTIIINGPLKDNKDTYIELPNCSRGHKINIIERSLNKLNDYKIITQLTRQYNSGTPYEGDIIIDGNTKTQGSQVTFAASETHPTITDGKGGIFSEMTSGAYTFQSIALNTATCKQLIYTGDLSSYTDEGVWMCI